MRLIGVQVQNFKCVDDSTPFRIDNITCRGSQKEDSSMTPAVKLVENRMMPRSAGPKGPRSIRTPRCSTHKYYKNFT